MPPYTIENFNLGVDVRRPAFAAKAGTLSVGTNVHLTRGGDIEVRKDFVIDNVLSASTFGLAELASQLWTFGSAAGVTVPAGYNYQQLVHEGGQPMSQVIDTDTFDGKLYVIAKFANGDVRHFYDGDMVLADTTPITGDACRTLNSKLYRIDGANMRFSAVDDPTDQAGTGAGFTNISNHSSGAEALKGLELYYDSVSLFGDNAIQIWHVEANDANNARIQTFRNVGLVAPRATTIYLDGDTPFLSRQGLKALTPRDSSSGRSRVDDTSYQIDPLLIADMRALDETTLSKAILLPEPDDNRLLLFIGNKVYVLSAFPSAQIRAWTTYELDFVVDDAVVCNHRLFVRAGNEVYLYGGQDGVTYGDYLCTARVPYATLNAPATFKDLNGMDIGAEGQWDVYVALSPDDTDDMQLVARYTGQSFDKPTIPMIGITTHISLEMRHQVAEYARLCSITFHYGSNTETS